MKKLLEQSIKEIVEQYNRIDTLYDNKRRFRYGEDYISSNKNVKIERRGIDNRDRRNTNYRFRSWYVFSKKYVGFKPNMWEGWKRQTISYYIR